MLIGHKYLVIPYNNHMALKKVEFYNGAELVYDINIKLDFFTPEHYAYVDMTEFLGMDLNVIWRTTQSVYEITEGITAEQFGEGSFYLQQIDALPEMQAWEERYRPYIHFTPRYGWMNDPNGLVFADGVYHLFYQHNPTGLDSENMHWGHAVSLDLFHWTHMDDALFPDKNGTIFSGSAVVDRHNLLKLEKSGHSTIVLFYTAAGGTSQISSHAPFTICMAYSTDGGCTFRKYENNPVVPNIVKFNRDPKVVYCPPLKAYVMAIYMENSRYCLLSSENLIDWRAFQSFNLPGSSECPDFYPITLEEEPDRDYWVFCGAGDHYFIGEFTDGKFCSSQPVKLLHYGRSSYAAQTFSGCANRRILRFSWLRTSMPSAPFSGQMSIPTQAHLIRLENELYLCIQPAEEIRQLYRTMQEYANLHLMPERSCVLKIAEDTGKIQSALDLYIEARYSGDATLAIQLLGFEVFCDMGKNQIRCNGCTSPMSILQRQMKLRMIIDKNSVEIFLDEGEFYISSDVLCDYQLNRLILTVSRELIIKKIKVSALRL